jgi:hypothetical protein
VVELGAVDGLFAILASLAGARASWAIPEDARGETVHRNARINGADIQVVAAQPEDVDVLVAHTPYEFMGVATTSPPVVLLLNGVVDGSLDLPDHRVVGIVDGTPVVKPGNETVVGPHLVVPEERLEEVVAVVTEAAAAYIRRSHKNPVSARWANQSVSSCLRLVEYYRAQSDVRGIEAQERVQRAHSQMQDALDELRAVRRSRSWRLTRPLRKIHRL